MALLNVKYAGKQYIDNSGGNNPDGTPNWSSPPLGTISSWKSMKNTLAATR